MVKAGTLPDYYGDLELKPGADPNDVKKQYKKLGKTPTYPKSCIRLRWFSSAQISPRP